MANIFKVNNIPLYLYYLSPIYVGSTYLWFNYYMWVRFRIDICPSGDMVELFLVLFSPVILSFSIFLFQMYKDDSRKLGTILVCLLLAVIGIYLTFLSSGITGLLSA